MDENIVKFQEKLRELVSLGKKKKSNCFQITPFVKSCVLFIDYPPYNKKHPKVHCLKLMVSHNF